MHLEDCQNIFGMMMAFDYTPKCQSMLPAYWPSSYMDVSHGLYHRNIRKLDQIDMCCLHRIARVRWQDKIPNTEVLQICGVTGVEAFIMSAQLRWVGHVMRMDDTRLPKTAFYCELVHGTQSLGGPRKRFKDMLNHESLRHTAQRTGVSHSRQIIMADLVQEASMCLRRQSCTLTARQTCTTQDLSLIHI